MHPYLKQFIDNYWFVNEAIIVGMPTLVKKLHTHLEIRMTLQILCLSLMDVGTYQPLISYKFCLLLQATLFSVTLAV